MPGRVEWADVDRTASVQTWTAEERSKFTAWGRVVGISPTEPIQLAGAWPGPEAAARPSINWKATWGTDFERKHAAFERALKAISDEDYERFRDAGLGNEGTEAAVEKIVAIGERLVRG